MIYKQYNITAVPKPRMTQSDKWKKRPCVVRYFEYKDQLRELGCDLSDRFEVIFYMPMPKSWSKKKKKEMYAKPHQQKPDLDNLVKGLKDAVLDDDSTVYQTHAKKYWSYEGFIKIRNLP